MTCLENPFADFSRIVYGESFLNRSSELRIVASRTMSSRNCGNLSIVGDCKIGKSSLAYQSFMTKRDELLNRQLLPVWINLGTCTDAKSVFTALMSCSSKELQRNGLLTDPQRALVSAFANSSNNSWTDCYILLEDYFTMVRTSGLRLLIILDEFDHARHIFSNDAARFQSLRELSYRPECRINYVTISRRSLREIESKAEFMSSFNGIFEVMNLGMFGDEGKAEFLGRLGIEKSILPPEFEEDMDFYCGGHPYLLSLFCYHAFEMLQSKEMIDTRELASTIQPALIDHYERMLDLVNERGNADRLVDVAFGSWDSEESDMDELIRYGIIRHTETGRLTTFSEHFKIFLRWLERRLELWTIWRKTEVRLRRFVQTEMLELFGEQWEEALVRKHPKLSTIFLKCSELRNRESLSFGVRASKELLDFAYPADLFGVVFSEWGHFSSIFGKDKKYWNDRSDLLSKLRNPMAHNRDSVIIAHEISLGRAYCEEILAILDSH